jgi:hypothetical protein
MRVVVDDDRGRRKKRSGVSIGNDVAASWRMAGATWLLFRLRLRRRIEG